MKIFCKNDLLSRFKLVGSRYVLLALPKKYYAYVTIAYMQKRRYRTVPLFFLGNLYFATGLVVAIKRYYVPVKIVQTEVIN